MTIAVSADKSGINQTTDAVSSANMMLFANDVDNIINNILNGIQAADKLLFSAADTEQIVGGVVGVPTKALMTYSAETGTADILNTIGVSNLRFLVIKPASGHSITINGTGSGNITSADGNSVILTGDRAALLFCHNSQWGMIGSAGGTVGSAPLHQLGSAVDPTPGEDSGDGYGVGSQWINTTADRAFINVDATATLAIWKRTTQPKNKWGVRAANASPLAVGIANPTLANAGANANDSSNSFMTLVTTAAAGNLGGWITASFNLIRPSHDPTFEILVKTGAAADLANQRLWIGLVDAEITNVDTLAAGREFIGFRYSSVAADPGWMPVLNDGTTQSVGTVLGGAIAAATVYKLRVRVVSGGTPTAYFSVNDGAEQAMTANFPPIATDLGAIVRNIAVTAVIRTVNFSTFDLQWG